MGIIKRKKHVSKMNHHSVEYKQSISEAEPKDLENNIVSYRKKILDHVVAGRVTPASKRQQKETSKQSEASKKVNKQVSQDDDALSVEKIEQKEGGFQEGFQAGYDQAKDELASQIKSETKTNKEELDAISKEAYQKAIEEARQEAQEENEEKLKQAFEEGVAQGKEDSKVVFSKKVEEIYAAIESFVAEKKTMLEQAREPIIDLALSMAVQNSIKKDEKLLLKLAEEGAQKLLESDSVVIRGNKESVAFLKTKKVYFEKKLPHIKTILFQEDPTIESEGCIFETDLGFVEATLEAKMAILKDAMHHEDLHE